MLPVSFVQHPKAQQEAEELRSGSGKGESLVQKLCGLAKITCQKPRQTEIGQGIGKGGDMLREPNGYWRVRDRSGNIKLIRDISEKAISQFDEVSVAAYTRSGKNITRIPLAVTFGGNPEDPMYGHNVNHILSLFSRAFLVSKIIKMECGQPRKFVYIFDDIEICKNLHISHKLYLDQFVIFADMINVLFQQYFTIPHFFIYREYDWIKHPDRITHEIITHNKSNSMLRFILAIRKLGSLLDCKFIRHVKFERYDIFDKLLMFRQFNYKIQYVMLYYMFNNLKEGNIDYRINKGIYEPRWDCLSDCKVKCGIKSPLHIPKKEHPKCYHPVEIKKEIVYRESISRVTLFLFWGCHILRHKKFFLNKIPLHLGIVGYIIQHDEKTRMFIDDFIQKYNDIVFDITQDISLLQIRNLRKVQGTSSILSFSSESVFIRSLRSRSPNYSKRISALKDATPFIESKDKKVCKLNILQFLDFETLIKTFSYGPLKKTGYLERAIVCHTGELSSINIEQIQKIAKFCMNSKDTIYLKINIEKIDKRFSYEFDRDATIFTRQGVRKFFTTIAIQLAILHEITKGNCTIDNDHLQVSEGALDEGCFLANAIIRERDERIRILTKQKRCLEAVKNFIITSKQDFFYHRDLQRRFSSYSPSCLNAVIKRLIGDFLIEEVVPNCPRYRGKVIIYKKQKRYFQL